jgi:hypothetical protein
MMTTNTHHDDIASKLAAIKELPRADLIERWEAHHGRSAPKGISRRLLEYSAAYQLQAKAYGGLSPVVRQKLMRAMPAKQTAGKANEPIRRTQLSPGARLVREWHGETHTVEVLKEGYAYDGELHRSLSEIARKITGARWSGPRFFGL